ncbi:MAG: serine/threonine protein kinase [Deltaproteobacteria bacterium]|nr:serine/threonine protein kinase [Deltaproteobacteria bacterium]
MSEAKRYEVIRKLATGGMAEIFLARQSGIGGFRRHVVLKRILPAHASDQNWVASFLNEASLAAALNHPNIVQVYDVGRHRDSYIMAMEYIDGKDLETLVKTHREVGTYMPLRVALTYLSDVLSALDYAHDASDVDGNPLGLIHRDISTSNIMVTHEGQAKILDFGIAKMLQPKNEVEQTQVGVVRGKASCLSPEQVRGQAIDRRIDVHACGVLLFELLTNTNPFKVADQMGTLRNVLELVPRLPADRAEAVPEPIQYVLSKALEKDPNARFQTCGVMLAALELALERCGYGFSRTQARNYMHQVDTAPASSEAMRDREVGEPKSQDELTEQELEVPEEKTRNIRRPVAPIATLGEAITPPRTIAPASLALFELNDVIADDHGAAPLVSQQFEETPKTSVRVLRPRRRGPSPRTISATLACAAFLVFTSFQAWQPAAAEAPTLSVEEEQSLDLSLSLVAPPVTASADPDAVDAAKKDSRAKKHKRSRRH